MADVANEKKITYVGEEDLSAAITDVILYAKRKFATKEEAKVASVATCKAIISELN